MSARSQRLGSSGAVLGFVVAVFAVLATPSQAQAIPAFARKYGTSCNTCHTAYPALTPFGEAFKYRGFRYPGDDEDFVEEDKTVLGQEAYKKVWPNAVWPSDVASVPPLSVRTVMLANRTEKLAGSTATEVGSDFLFPNNVYLLTGGTIGEDLSWFGHMHLLSEGEDGLGVGRFYFQHDNLLGAHLKIGRFQPKASPFSSYTLLGLRDYALNTYSFSTGTDFNGGGGHHGGGLSLGRNDQGLELWGITAHRLLWAAGYVNGSGTGLAGGTTADNNDHKDWYARLSYKLGGLPLDGEGGDPNQAGLETSLQLGAFAFQGDATVTDTDLGTVDLQDVTTYRKLGGDLTLRLGALDLRGALVVGEDDLHKQVTRLRYTIKHQISSGEVSYQVKPWLLPYARWELVDREGMDDLGRTIVGAAVQLRANVRLNLEAVRNDDVGGTEVPDTAAVALDFAF